MQLLQPVFCSTRKAMGSTDAMQPVSEVPQILQQNPMVDVKPNMLYFKIPIVIKKSKFQRGANLG